MSSQTPDNATLKWVSLLTLIVQNSSLVLMMRYSRTLSSSTSYLPSTAVVCAEVLKFCMSFVLYAMEESKSNSNGHSDGFSLVSVTRDLLGPHSRWLYMTVPAILYFIQNNLQYHAVSMVCNTTIYIFYTILTHTYTHSKSLMRLPFKSRIK